MTGVLYGHGGPAARKQHANHPALVAKPGRPQIVVPGPSRQTSKASDKTARTTAQSRPSKLDEASRREVRDPKALWIRGTPQSSWFDSPSQDAREKNINPAQEVIPVGPEDGISPFSNEAHPPRNRLSPALRRTPSPRKVRNITKAGPPPTADMIGSQIGMQRRLAEQEKARIAEEQRQTSNSPTVSLREVRVTRSRESSHFRTLPTTVVPVSTDDSLVSQRPFVLQSDVAKPIGEPQARSTQDYQASADKYEAARDEEDSDFQDSIDLERTTVRPRSARKLKRAAEIEPGLFVTGLTQDSIPVTIPDSIEERVARSATPTSPSDTIGDRPLNNSDRDQIAPETAAHKRPLGPEDTTPPNKKPKMVNRPKNSDRVRPRDRAWRYEKLRDNKAKRERDGIIAEIEGNWGGSILSVVPEAIRPRLYEDKTIEVPTAPRDWSGKVLKALMQLATMTLSSPELAAALLQQAVQRQYEEHGGHRWIQCKEDIEVACELFDEYDSGPIEQSQASPFRQEAGMRGSELAIREREPSTCVGPSTASATMPRERDDRKREEAGRRAVAPKSYPEGMEIAPQGVVGDVEAAASPSHAATMDPKTPREVAIEEYVQARKKLAIFMIEPKDVDNLYGLAD